MSHTSFARLLPLVALAALVALSAGRATPAHGASFTVNATHDSVDAAPGDGVCADAGGTCTLRAAIMETNALPGADEISLPAGTYAHSISGVDEDASATGDLDITDDLTISGAGRDPTMIDGGALDRVIHILSGATSAISAVTVQNGSGLHGAGLSNEGDLSLTASIVRSNFAVAAPGCPDLCGAPSGGGISNLGTAHIAETLLIDNHASVGGGIVNFVSGSLSITRSQIQANTAVSEGGAVSNFGSLQIMESGLTHNLVGSTGGAIDNSGEVTVNGSILDDNRSDYGGGLYNQNFSQLTNVTVSGNLARITGGGIVNAGASYVVMATNVTIASNDAPNGGGLHNGPVDRIGEGGLASLANTIIALNTNGGDCSGPITSLGHNLDSDGTCGLTGLGDQSGGYAGLGPIADNGGPTQTHEIHRLFCYDNSDECDAPSSAIDAGDPSACPATDQRGDPRPFDGDGDGVATCDIGAYEQQQGPRRCQVGCSNVVQLTPTPVATPVTTPALPIALPPTGGAGESRIPLAAPAVVAALVITAGAATLCRRGLRRD